MDTESIGKLLGGLLTGGVVGNATVAIGEGLKLANHLLEPDPAKRAKVRRDFFLAMVKLIHEQEGADVKDVSDLDAEFVKLLNE